MPEKERTCKKCGHLASEHRYQGGCEGIVDEVIAFSDDGPVISQGQCPCDRSMRDVEEGF